MQAALHSHLGGRQGKIKQTNTIIKGITWDVAVVGSRLMDIASLNMFWQSDFISNGSLILKSIGERDTGF